VCWWQVARVELELLAGKLSRHQATVHLVHHILLLLHRSLATTSSPSPPLSSPSSPRLPHARDGTCGEAVCGGGLLGRYTWPLVRLLGSLLQETPPTEWVNMQEASSEETQEAGEEAGKGGRIWQEGGMEVAGFEGLRLGAWLSEAVAASHADGRCLRRVERVVQQLADLRAAAALELASSSKAGELASSTWPQRPATPPHTASASSNLCLPVVFQLAFPCPIKPPLCLSIGAGAGAGAGQGCSSINSSSSSSSSSISSSEQAAAAA